MKLYQNDNFTAFEELYGRYTSRVYSYLRKRLSSSEAIEDLYQKVFLKLHENRGKYDDKLLFAPWLFTITRNVLIDWYRLKKDLP
ncbi:MAG: RNA polymerase sigma factor, partial [Bdellovibrionales bacterium]|nr:RNA polymerase sigma factor [Bdellovibrionales bacterium]